MVWVLWDILIPLLASFALGTLLAWLVWRRRQGNEALVTVSGVTTSDAMALTATDTAGEDLAADSEELEAANIILIGERDKAALELETMQEEAIAMKQRIAELEAADSENANRLAEAAYSETAAVDVALAAGVNMDNHGVEDQQRIQADLDALNETLNRERKARRATELELLNTKNRHEKFVANVPAHISEELYQREITERDEQIDKLKQQLAERNVVESQTQTPDVNSRDETPEGLEVELPDVELPEVKLPEVELKDEPEKKPLQDNVKMPPVSRSSTAKNGYTPKGWSVPDATVADNEKDKLTDIKGVGKVLEKMLHDCGIYFYHQIASLDESGVEELQSQFPQFPGRIQRDRWIEQAKELQKKKELVEG